MEAGRQRLDKWLWHARLARTRSAAQTLVESGHVRVNREKIVQTSRAVRIGDVITVAVGGRVRVLRIVGFAERRGPPASVSALYDDLAPPPAGERSETADDEDDDRGAG
ncbi:RNA-binding S4 domain-containing protein [Segnochrobactrum spirostomi]|uniref:RNA-binding S4 domain-containing protein n=1 Tax=Segnochrobactrum spirostomi TaxID=2608987 RepID=A0A6A7Y1J2_9HYPH|nr:RNA-binding S4 domain-containing protein [Segnochrobactrum spirostomi]MQT12813.1 RNA-binding S4 domain-containing protein [Segnochrobactrum spirostomi]